MPTLTRQEAVAEMVDGAIGAWLEGRLACAITLAGAAETGMPKVGGGTSTFEAFKNVLKKIGKCSDKQAADILTAERNWLKHFSEDKPEIIYTDQAWVYVTRAYLQFRVTYPDAKMTVNMQKMQARFDEQLEPLRQFALAMTLLARRMVNAFADMAGKPPTRP